MSVCRTIAMIALPALMASAQSHTPAQAENIVKKAIAYARQNGIEKLLLQTNLPHGIFHVGSGSELYLFVYDQKGVARANGFQTEYVGTSRLDVKDADGFYQVREFIKTAKTKGSGWVEYRFANPVTKQTERKATYVEGYENHVFCCGIYKK